MQGKPTALSNNQDYATQYILRVIIECGVNISYHNKVFYTVKLIIINNLRLGTKMTKRNNEMPLNCAYNTLSNIRETRYYFDSISLCPILGN